MKRIVVEGYTTAERKLMLESLRVVRALLREVELGIVAPERVTAPVVQRDRVSPPQRSSETTGEMATISPIGRFPQQRWAEILPAILRGELDEYSCVQKTGSAHASASTLRRKYPGLTATIDNNGDGTSLLTFRLEVESESA